jgi:hypothetical protein
MDNAAGVTIVQTIIVIISHHENPFADAKRAQTHQPAIVPF